MAEEGTGVKHDPSFFKVLIDLDSAKLKLPPAFVRRNIQWNLPETISLKLDSGMSWNVKMGRDGTGCYFARGWSKFVKDLKLEAWDFLIFRLIQEKEFEVAVYGVNCCEKDISCYASSAAVNKEKVKFEAEETVKGNSPRKSVNLYIQKRLSDHDRRVLMVTQSNRERVSAWYDE